jgi:hypothetical protein
MGIVILVVAGRKDGSGVRWLAGVGGWVVAGFMNGDGDGCDWGWVRESLRLVVDVGLGVKGIPLLVLGRCMMRSRFTR